MIFKCATDFDKNQIRDRRDRGFDGTHVRLVEPKRFLSLHGVTSIEVSLHKCADTTLLNFNSMSSAITTPLGVVFDFDEILKKHVLDMSDVVSTFCTILNKSNVNVLIQNTLAIDDGVKWLSDVDYCAFLVSEFKRMGFYNIGLSLDTGAAVQRGHSIKRVFTKHADIIKDVVIRNHPYDSGYSISNAISLPKLFDIFVGYTESGCTADITVDVFETAVNSGRNSEETLKACKYVLGKIADKDGVTEC